MSDRLEYGTTAKVLHWLIVALLLEQWRPLSDRRYIHTAVSQYAGYFEHQFNAGENQHGIIAWMLAVLPLVLGLRFAAPKLPVATCQSAR